jgi:hypothetical protein
VKDQIPFYSVEGNYYCDDEEIEKFIKSLVRKLVNEDYEYEFEGVRSSCDREGSQLNPVRFQDEGPTIEVSFKSVTGVLALTCENENPTSIERHSLLNVI